MCQFASMVLTKEAVFWSKNTDSHEYIIKEFGLHEGANPKHPNFMRVELLPPGGDPFSDPASWTYKVDQDLMPKWANEKADKERAREALKKLVEARVFVGKSSLELSGGERVFVKDCRYVVAWGSSRVEAWGSSSVEAHDSSSVEAHDFSSVEAYDSSSVSEVRDFSVVRHFSSTAPCKPIGPHAVVIDSRGERSKCVVER